jgi:hypothetical protein
MEIKPYKSFGPLNFHQTTMNECLQLLGPPRQRRINREGIEEFQYDQYIVRFDPLNRTVRECTLLPHMDAIINGIKVTWDNSFLHRACELDGLPRDVYGLIVLPSLGIAVTGIHDNDDTQLAITAFSKGDFDDLLAESIPFPFSLGRKMREENGDRGENGDAAH